MVALIPRISSDPSWSFLNYLLPSIVMFDSLLSLVLSSLVFHRMRESRRAKVASKDRQLRSEAESIGEVDNVTVVPADNTTAS